MVIRSICLRYQYEHWNNLQIFANKKNSNNNNNNNKFITITATYEEPCNIFSRFIDQSNFFYRHF